MDEAEQGALDCREVECTIESEVECEVESTLESATPTI